MPGAAWQAEQVARTGAPRIVRPPEKTSPARRASLVAWVCLLIVWVVWGSTYLAIRVAVETMPPLLMAAVRNLVAGAIMFPAAMGARRRAIRAGQDLRRWPSRAEWIGCATVGVLLLVANGAVGIGERTCAVRTGRAAGRHRSAVAARHRRGAEPRPSGPGPDGRARPRPGRRRPAVRPRRRCGPGLRGRRGHHPGRRGHVGARHDHGPPGHDPVQPGPGQRDGTALRRRGAAGPGRGGRGTRLAAPGRGVLAVLARARLLDRGRVHRRVLRLRHRGPHAAHRHGGDLRVREPGDRGPARRAHPERAADPGHVRRRGADRRGGGARRAPQPASTPNNRATATRGGHTCTGWTEWQSRVMPC